MVSRDLGRQLSGRSDGERVRVLCVADAVHDNHCRRADRDAADDGGGEAAREDDFAQVELMRAPMNSMTAWRAKCASLRELRVIAHASGIFGMYRHDKAYCINRRGNGVLSVALGLINNLSFLRCDLLSLRRVAYAHLVFKGHVQQACSLL